MKRLITYFKKETVLCAAMFLAVVSMFLIHPDSQYLEYLDCRTLALLFSLMTIMEGFKQTGLFRVIAQALLMRVHTFRQLYLVLVMLCFFCSMWITNDVSLLTFVPFTILVLELAGLQKEMIPVIVMQTIAANLGSMMTPVGNPQNLYLYSVSGMDMGQFLLIMAPLSILSFLMILGACILHKNFTLKAGIAFSDTEAGIRKNGENVRKDTRKQQNLLLGILFLVSLLSVFRILSWTILLLIVLAGCLCLSSVLHGSFLPKKVDYSLLLTFLAFFIFIGNMKRIDLVRDFLDQMLKGRELLVSFGCSQVISNVPAAILLSGFTDQYAALLRGVNIGGLGTLIASLASLISYKFFAENQGRSPECGTKQRYLIQFTLWNVGMAAVLLLAAIVLK